MKRLTEDLMEDVAHLCYELADEFEQVLIDKETMNLQDEDRLVEALDAVEMGLKRALRCLWGEKAKVAS